MYEEQFRIGTSRPTDSEHTRRAAAVVAVQRRVSTLATPFNNSAFKAHWGKAACQRQTHGPQRQQQRCQQLNATVEDANAVAKPATPASADWLPLFALRCSLIEVLLILPFRRWRCVLTFARAIQQQILYCYLIRALYTTPFHPPRDIEIQRPDIQAHNS